MNSPKKELLFTVSKNDLEISYFSGHGPGGQHRNKCKNCVRIHHPESGARSTGQNHREKSRNIKDALNTLVNNPKFKIWWHRKVYEILNKKPLNKKLKSL